MRKAVLVILKKERKILMQLRDHNPEISYPGYWSFIGGSVEGKESNLEAIKREIKEEINIKVKNIKEIGKITVINDPKTTDVEVAVFVGLVDVRAEEIDLKEGEKVKYFSYKEIMNLKAPDRLKKFLRENRKEIFASEK